MQTVIPYLDPKHQIDPIYRAYLDALAERGFSGEIQTDYASRLVVATDNSVYQVMPAGVLFPRNEKDVIAALALLGEARFAGVKLSPRGGGTGTNGQSLSDGLIMDVSRHMASILETNLAEGWVRVQPGVVLDELNANLKPHGVFFAPNLSPSNRATIGGMISTDASGKGSRVYGKTSQHVLGLRCVLIDGSVLDARPIDRATLAAEKRRGDLTGSIYRTVDDVVTTHADKIANELPKLARFVTGYDLAHVHRADGAFDLTTVISGSEGTLGVLTEAKLRLTKLPKYRELIAIRYADFDSALRAASVLVKADPGAIETIDNNIVALAKNDIIWHSVAHLLAQTEGEPPLEAVNLVEFESDDVAMVKRKVEELQKVLDESLRLGSLDFTAPKASGMGRAGRSAMGYTVVREPKDIAALWTLRKKGVGLLGNAKGERRPIPFVEDTAVPPERLADYIRDFRKILDDHGLRYGMFGHVDVGCLHVRPALDMRDERDERLLRAISDQVVVLTKRYGGVLWGEHGKGYRGEYATEFFGPELYEQMRRVKGAFDPHNQLNPGKLAAPPNKANGTGTGLISIDTVKRGKHDRQIHPLVRQEFDTTIHCNGNGACFDWSPDSTMCPSFMATRDRIHSPKGRAGVMREWLRLLALQGHDAGVTRRHSGEEREGEELIAARTRSREPDDFSHQVYDAMNGCLACKACATQCPIKVDVPAFRSEFLEQYHGRYRRPLKDYFIAALESSLVIMALVPKVFNAFLKSDFFSGLLRRVVGMVDTPLLAESSLDSGLRARGAPAFDMRALAKLSADEKKRTVLVVQDAFTTFYEPNVALAAYDVLTAIGKRVVFMPYRANGKGLHVKGFLRRFEKIARRRGAELRDAASLGVPIVGLEPAVALTYRDEYVHALGKDAAGFQVQLLQEYLVKHCLDDLASLAGSVSSGSVSSGSVSSGSVSGTTKYKLFGHCTEKTAEPASQGQWQKAFKAAGVDLELVATGCCGMCGAYGHEAEHAETSRNIFAMSWAKALPSKADARASVLATGHSCRSQVKRIEGFVPMHPMEALRDAVVSHER